VRDLVFVRTRYEYKSYSDLWHLVELSGFKTVYVDQFDLETDYVGILPTCNGELRPHITHRRSILKGPQWATLIHWNLERPDSGDYEVSKITPTGVANSTSEILQYVDYQWVSDRYWASLDPRLVYVPIGSHPELAQGPPDAKEYDACALSYNNFRRDRVIGPLKQQVRMAPDSAWGEERDRILRRSRAMVYVHQTPMPIGAPLRMALAAAYKLPVIAERLADPYPYVPGHDILMFDYDVLVPSAVEALRDPARLEEIGRNLHRRLCMEEGFRKCVEEGVGRTLAA
jgi:hypothetical protein